MIDPKISSCIICDTSVNTTIMNHKIKLSINCTLYIGENGKLIVDINEIYPEMIVLNDVEKTDYQKVIEPYLDLMGIKKEFLDQCDKVGKEFITDKSLSWFVGDLKGMMMEKPTVYESKTEDDN